MRPRQWYAVYAAGRIVGIAHGKDAAIAMTGCRVSNKGFKTKLAAEEFAAWFEYRRWKEQAARDNEIRARLREKGKVPFTDRLGAHSSL